MPDIMCVSNICQLKAGCYRATASPSSRQSIADFSNYITFSVNGQECAQKIKNWTASTGNNTVENKGSNV